MKPPNKISIPSSSVEEFYNELKGGDRFNKPTVDAISKEISKKYGVIDELYDVLKTKVKRIYHYVTKKPPVPVDENDVLMEILVQEIDIDEDEEAGGSGERGFYKSILDVNEYTRRKRIGKLMPQFETLAVEQKCTVNQLLGLVLHQANYTHDREVASIGNDILNNRPRSELSMDQAIGLTQAL